MFASGEMNVNAAFTTESMSDSVSASRLLQRRVRTAAVWTLVAWLPVLIGRGAVASAAALWSSATSAHPYFVADHWALVYVWTPLVIVSGAVLLMSPGLFASLACNRGTNVGAWVVSALALSVVVVSGGTALVQTAIGAPVRDGLFVVVVVGCALGAFCVWVWRLGRCPDLAWPFEREHSRFGALSMLAVPILLLITLAPKFYWESFNGDGAHAYETARLLLVRALPFWPAEAGDIAAFPGITSTLFAYPASWFIRLFGELEVSARLPYLLYVVALFGVIVVLSELGRSRVLNPVDQMLIWTALVIYTVAVGFSATYDPYSADLALPATQDTLAVVCFLSFVWTLLNRQWVWVSLFAALTYLSLPIGLLLMAFWLAAMVLLWTPRPWAQIGLVGTIVGGCVAVAALVPVGLTALHVPAPGGEYAGGELLSRFAFLQWSDWRRLVFVAVPTGIVPACALLAWRAQDRVARAFTLVTLAYFAFFFIQARAAFHHYVPAMLFPLVVLWRLDMMTRPYRRVRVLAVVAATEVASLVLSLPRHATPAIAARLTGMTIEDATAGYESVAPAAFRRSTLLHELFPYDSELAVPLNSYGGSPLAWNYYAHQRVRGSREANYALHPATDPAPAGMRPVARDDDTVLYVKSDDVWAQHRALRPPAPAGAAIYAIPRDLTFGPLPRQGSPRVLDVKRTLENWGVDVDSLLLRLGVRR